MSFHEICQPGGNHPHAIVSSDKLIRNPDE
ncbi:DUF3982 domain-containing protein [candidate division KSB1 bacterium]